MENQKEEVKDVSTEEESAEQEMVTEETNETKEADVSEEATEVEEVDELTLLKQQLEEEQDRTVRLRADFENYKRRVQKDKEADYKYRAQSLLSDLLPVLDNLERALAVEAISEEAISLTKGVDMVYRSLVAAVEKEGLESVESEGNLLIQIFIMQLCRKKTKTKIQVLFFKNYKKATN